MKYKKIIYSVFLIGMICVWAFADDPNRGSAKTGRKGNTIIYFQPIIIYNTSGTYISTGYGYENTVTAPVEKNKKEKNLPADVLIEDLKEIFTFALQNINDANTVQILQKLFDAQAAKIIYESSFTEQFRQKAAGVCPNDVTECYSLIQTTRKIAAENYWHYITIFKETKAKDNKINNELRQLLKNAIVQKLNADKKKFGKSNFNTSGDYLSRMLACAAINPQTGSVLNPALIYAGDWQVRQDTVSEKAVRLLNEIAGIQDTADPNGSSDPNAAKVN